eukprot:352421-Chlamydomonas_euryale.AAC.56
MVMCLEQTLADDVDIVISEYLLWVEACCHSAAKCLRRCTARLHSRPALCPPDTCGASLNTHALAQERRLGVKPDCRQRCRHQLRAAGAPRACAAQASSHGPASDVRAWADERPGERRTTLPCHCW